MMEREFRLPVFMSIASMHKVDLLFFQNTVDSMEEYNALYELYKKYYMYKVAIPYEIRKDQFQPYKLVAKYSWFKQIQTLIPGLHDVVPLTDHNDYLHRFLSSRTSDSISDRWPNLSTKLFAKYFDDTVEQLFPLTKFSLLYSGELYDDVDKLYNEALAIVKVGNTLKEHQVSGDSVRLFDLIQSALPAARKAVEELPNGGKF